MGFLAIACSLLLPQLIRLIVDFVFLADVGALANLKGFWATLINGPFGAIGSWELLVWLCCMYLALVLARNTIIYSRNVYWHHVSQLYGKQIRSFGFSNFIGRLQSVASQNEMFVLLTHDVTSFKNLILFHLAYVIENAFVVALSVFFVFGIHPNLGFWVLATLPFAIAIGVVFNIKASAILKNAREQFSLLSATAQESLNASRNLKTLHIGNFISQRFQQTNTSYLDAKKSEVNITAAYVLSLEMFKSVGYALMIIVGILYATSGAISTGEFVSFIAYSLIVFVEVVRLFRNVLDFQIVHVSASRFANYITEKDSVLPFKAKEIITKLPAITIEDLRISFKDKEVISKLSLFIPYGKHIAIVGHQGEGKSMLAGALLRLKPTNAGSILINNYDIKEINTESLRQQFSFVTQEPFLFTDTVKENIMLYDAIASEESLQHVVQLVGLDRWLSKLKGGLNYRIPENATGVPNQERQLISFARALYKNAPILLLDSPFNVFDDEQASLLRKNVFAFYQNKTIILITNHPKDAMECDTILFMDKGKIVETGSPQELLEKNGKFASFARKNIDDFEEDWTSD